jgi:hypothetical protein
LLRKTANECRAIWAESPRPPKHWAGQTTSTSRVEATKSVSANNPNAYRDHTANPSSNNHFAQTAWTGALPTRLPARANDLISEHDVGSDPGDEIQNELVEDDEPDDDGDADEHAGYADEDEEHHDAQDPRSLTRRGTTSWFCPKKWNCTKGGVENDQLREFSRHSDIR